MKSRREPISGDFLAYAILIRDRRLRATFLRAAQTRLIDESKDLKPRQGLIAEPAILDTGAALKFDRWGLYPELGDRRLSFTQYFNVRLSLIRSEAEAEDLRGCPPLSLRPVRLAVRDISSHHGLPAVIPFVKTCWKKGLILNLDDFFWAMFTAMRCEAFGLEWEQCTAEIQEAEKQASSDSTSGNLTIATRARRLAEIDATLARDSKALEATARREHQSAEALLTAAKQQPFSRFLRDIFALRPVYYTLRDVWFELHFLTSDPEDRSEFEYLESFVDEVQADIGQMTLHPLAGPIFGDIARWNGNQAQCRRHIDFWEHSRVQINHAIAQTLRARLDLFQGQVDGNALRKQLRSLMAKSLSKGQHLAMQMWDTELIRRVEEKKNEPS